MLLQRRADAERSTAASRLRATADSVTAWFADAATEQPEERTTPPIEDPVLSMGAVSFGDPAESGAGGQTDREAPEAEAGGAEAIVDGEAPPAGAHLQVEPAGPPMAGLGGGTWMLPDELVGEAPDGPAESADPDPSDPSDGTAALGPIVSPKDAASVAERLGGVSLEAPPLISRFVDLCAEGATLCPSGIGATVVPLGGPIPDSLAAMLWPGVSTGADPALRCEPGFHTAECYPLAVTTSAPVARLDITFALDGLGVLHETTLVTSSAESSRWEKAVTQGGVAGVGLGAGVQHCVSLPTELDPANVARYPGAVRPDPRVYRIDAFAVAAQGKASVRVTSTVTPPAPGPRPPTVVVPVTGHVVQVKTAERPDATSRARLASLGAMGATPDAVLQPPLGHDRTVRVGGEVQRRSRRHPRPSGLPGDCPQYDRLRARGMVIIDEGETNGRRSQLAWVIAGPGA